MIKKILLYGLIVTMTFGMTSFTPQAAAEQSAMASWIIKWKNNEDPAFQSMSEVIERWEKMKVVVARPGEGYQLEDWLSYWRESNAVEYIQLNQQVTLHASPNDALYSTQSYLKQIRAEAAWNVAKENNNITIAIVDTGVDLQHPDLQANLIPGTNIINPNASAQDDNGHGTNIAGVVGAIGNNEIGVSGILWKGKIMPIKAVAANGTTEENKLGKGIVYAVDHGAKIVVLSLGLYKYSPFMRDIVQYAEDHDVLLVAASGNDGQAVKYPAAYPTVLAVGGVGDNGRVNPNSNRGPELDLVAPWKVYTTALNGLYESNEGTSMAAPQAAAVAALIWSRYPNLKPYEIRNILRQTAEDIGPAGWDEQSGYGLLRADRALIEVVRQDIYENNNTRETAKPMPIDSMLSAALQGTNDTDWYTLNAPYDGQITFNFTVDASSYLSQLELVYYANGSRQGVVYSDLTKEVSIDVTKGQSHIQIRPAQSATIQIIPYRVEPMFTIAADPFEDNDRQYKAYVLPAQLQSITGTFHQLNDIDWYMLSVKEAGSLQVEVAMNTYRMDVELMIQRQGETAKTYDYFFDGQTEYSPMIDVQPGNYYIRVRNAISDQAYPVTGEYTLKVNYLRKYVDPNEPNDRAFQSTSLSFGNSYTGVFTEGDVDWFTFQLREESYITFKLSNIPADRMISLHLLNNNQEQMFKEVNQAGDSKLTLERTLPAGRYYLRLTANRSFDHQLYQLEVTAQPFTAGYRDIKGHWAEAEIIKLTEAGIVTGYADRLFHPDRMITRAEAVTMIVQALGLATESTKKFTDVTERHWAAKEISIAAAAGIVNGYPDGSFRPDQATNRAEMTMMIAGALGMNGISTGPIPFTDVSMDDWWTAVLRQMKAEQWIQGYADGTFKPLQTATRAEFVTFITRIMP